MSGTGSVSVDCASFVRLTPAECAEGGLPGSAAGTSATRYGTGRVASRHARRARPEGMTTLSGGHFAVDFASGAVPALLPFLAVEFDLSYTATAVLMLSVLVSSSLVQPLFGLWSDRRGALWLLPGGLALAGVGTGLAAVAPTYGLVLVLVFLAGIGIAAYHPEGAKLAAYRQRAQARERHVLLQHRRQYRLRARADRDHPARPVARTDGGLARDAAGARLLARAAAGASRPRPGRPDRGDAGRHPAGGTTSAR